MSLSVGNPLSLVHIKFWGGQLRNNWFTSCFFYYYYYRDPHLVGKGAGSYDPDFPSPFAPVWACAPGYYISKQEKWNLVEFVCMFLYCFVFIVFQEIVVVRSSELLLLVLVWLAWVFDIFSSLLCLYILKVIYHGVPLWRLGILWGCGRTFHLLLRRNGM